MSQHTATARGGGCMYTVFGLMSNLKTLLHDAAPDSGLCKSPRACDRMGGLMFGLLFFYYYYFGLVWFSNRCFFLKKKRKKTINNNKLAEMGLCVCVEPKVSNENAQGFLHSSLVRCFFGLLFCIDISYCLVWFAWFILGGKP